MDIKNIITVPTVKEERYTFDMISRLLDDRIIMAHDQVNNDSAQMIVSQLLYLDSKDNTKPINIYLDCPGGSVLSGLAVIDTIGLIDSPVYMHAIGCAASMGAMYLAFGAKGHRYATQNAQIMIHQVSAGTRGTVADMEKSFEHSKKLNDKLMDMLAERTGQSTTKIKKLCQRDHWMSAHEAKELGLVDVVHEGKWK